MKIPSIHEYRGFFAQQVPSFGSAMAYAFKNEAFARIIEIGTGRGGCIAEMRRLYPLTEIHSWDIDRWLYEDQLEALNLNFNHCDAMEDTTIPSLIASAGRTLVMCDGGNKIEEFRKFAEFLKPADMIMAHDYCSTKEMFEAEIRGRFWNWLEITDADIADSVEENGLVFVHGDLRCIAWGCWIKS